MPDVSWISQYLNLLLIIFTTNYMLKQPPREPIQLASLRKRSKIDEPSRPRQAQRNKSIEYDLQLFQESLNIHRESRPQEISWEQFSSEHMVSSKASNGNETGIFFKNEPRSWIDMKLNFNSTQNQSLGHSNVPKNMVSSLPSSYSSIHKTNACPKPNTSKIQNKENNIPAGKENPTKTRTISTICTLKSDVLREIKMLNQNQPQGYNPNDKKEQNPSIHSQIYEKRIKQLQSKNEQAWKKVSALQEKLKEKDQMTSRLDQIQKDLNMLYEENKELLKMNESLSKISLHSEDPATSEVQIQTEIFPIYVNDSFCQTIPGQLQTPLWAQRTQLQCDTEHEMQRSGKNWKNQYELERLSLINRQIEFRTTIQNTHIQHRLQLDRLQRQYDALAINYEHKCQQVRDKDSLIAKYLFKKP